MQWAGQTTLAAQRAIEQAELVFFAVVDPCTVRWIRQLNPHAESLPYPLDNRPRLETYLVMANRIMTQVRAGKHVCAVFYGHPGVLTTPAHEMARQARHEGFSVRMLPGVSSLACLFADLCLDPGQAGCQIYEANDFLTQERIFDARTPLILCQVGLIGNRSFYDQANTEQIRAGLRTLHEGLSRHFPADHDVILYEAAMMPIQRPRIDRIPLKTLPAAVVSDLSTLYVPPLLSAFPTL